MLENLSIMANMHVFWSLREGALTFQVRFETGAYLACLKSCPWLTPGLFYCAKRNETKRNILGKEKKCLLLHAAIHEIFPRLIVETASVPKKPQPFSCEATLVLLIAWLFWMKIEYFDKRFREINDQMPF